MKTRIIDENGNIVWFGSVGKNEDGTAKFVKTIYVGGEKLKFNYDEGINLSYDDGNEGIKHSLTQQLSVIQGELWYNIKAGIPLLEKQRNKGIIDSYIVSIVLGHSDVISITSFDSYVENNHAYKCSLKCSTKYGNIMINI